MKTQELGVGIVYLNGFENIIETHENLIHTIEIEPQTLWLPLYGDKRQFTYAPSTIDYLQSLDKPITFHGVGYPIGGRLAGDKEHVDCLQRMIKDLQPVSMSEHLSFNTIKMEGANCNTNFLLPPLQTHTSIENIVESINDYRKNFNIPFLFETGVNYLQPQPFDIPDGMFVNTIAEKADCGILLDLHNIMANALNGRQDIWEYIHQLSFEKIQQIHLAGGFYHNGYYLDAHSSISSKEILNIFEKLVPQLPNLKTVTFELQSDFLNSISDQDMRYQLEYMNRVYDQRGTQLNNHKPISTCSTTLIEDATSPSIEEWEQTLGSLALQHETIHTTQLSTSLESDKGLAIIQELIHNFRGSFIVSTMPYTCRYLAYALGEKAFKKLLSRFWRQQLPQLYAIENGIDFAYYLLESDLYQEDKVLETMIVFEKISLEAVLYNTEIEFNAIYNPFDIIEALDNGILPKNLKLGQYCYDIPSRRIFIGEIDGVVHN